MKILNDLWELFFPRYCLVCGRHLLGCEEYLCHSCLSALPRTHLHKKPDNDVEKNFWGKFPIEKATAYLRYVKGGNVSKLLFELKYYGNSRLGHFLGRCMAAELLSSGFFRGIDCIVPVPLHPRKFKKRGYNQCEMLAEGLSSVTGIPVARNVLRRKQDAGTQTHKGSMERWMGVEGAFECIDSSLLEGKHVLLVDDVLTTGATLVSCADAFGKVFGLRISVLTLALSVDS